MNRLNVSESSLSQWAGLNAHLSIGCLFWQKYVQIHGSLLGRIRTLPTSCISWALGGLELTGLSGQNFGEQGNSVTGSCGVWQRSRFNADSESCWPVCLSTSRNLRHMHLCYCQGVSLQTIQFARKLRHQSRVKPIFCQNSHEFLIYGLQGENWLITKITLCSGRLALITFFVQGWAHCKGTAVCARNMCDQLRSCVRCAYKTTEMSGIVADWRKKSARDSRKM